ncbi:hypothetical protein WA026_010103 [Henosepilachna vigintioctopunctata]|uniref:Uncharacterized protein n=1 Tax=Henosepilachna vigintioctopunctata TaxID=420089 RepID=A0AAW1ULF0_9CUCU
MLKSNSFPMSSRFPRTRSAKSLKIEPDLIEKCGGGKICEIPATSRKPKVNIYPYWRPKKNLCLDYNLSQNHISVDCRKAKIFMRKTDATYVWNPKPVIPKQKRLKYGHGMMPPGMFVDEIWREKVDKKQQKYYSDLKMRLTTKRKFEQDRHMRRIFYLLYRNLTIYNYSYYKSQRILKCSCNICSMTHANT